jgi:hypothetical protein
MSSFVEPGDVVQRMRGAAGAQLCPRSRPEDALLLPEAHAALLRDGVSAIHGYVRLFGSGCRKCTDLSWWNVKSTWKFAWSGRVSPFLCFGETGWGDQYAYDIDALRRGDERVLLLDAFEMTPDEIAGSFEEFFEGRSFGKWSAHTIR